MRECFPFKHKRPPIFFGTSIYNKEQNNTCTDLSLNEKHPEKMYLAMYLEMYL